jgi:hypothetical protein
MLPKRLAHSIVPAAIDCHTSPMTDAAFVNDSDRPNVGALSH